jgi:hypothetical protein
MTKKDVTAMLPTLEMCACRSGEGRDDEESAIA